MTKNKIAVMVSGRGTNLQVILEAVANGECPADPQLVISNRSEALALNIARKAGVPHVQHIDAKNYSDRAMYDAACADLIDRHDCQWIVLAGYMRILSPSFVSRFRGRIINIHPSLLPAFSGAKAVEDALEYGVKVAGCTVHLVDEVLDGGSILSQSVVPVYEDDTRESLHYRIQVEEHKIYPTTLAKIITQGFDIQGRTVMWRD
ncbi:MAG: phosphoribosylglycinamide formyltransferase [Mariprofundaceae bacterium]